MVAPDTTGARVLDYLLGRPDLRFKQKRDGQWWGNSPLHSSDSGKFCLKVDEDGERGAYCCFTRSDEKGSLYDLADKLNIEISGTTRVESSRREYRDLKDYAEAHGAPPEAFTARSWYSDVEQQFNRPALRFKTVTGYRWRFLDGREPLFWHAEGYKPCWYGLAAAMKVMETQNVPNEDRYLVLCNGETSTVVGQYWGLPAVCITSSGEKPALSDDLLAKLKETGVTRILVCFDCDRQGRDNAPRMSDFLTANGFASVRTVDLKLGRGGDIADHCKLYQHGSEEQLWSLPPVEPFVFDERDFADSVAQLQQDIKALHQEVKKNGSGKPEDLEKVLALAERSIEAVRSEHTQITLTSFADVARAEREALPGRVSNPTEVTGLHTGIVDLDKAIGGLDGVTVVIANTNNCKTTLAASVTVGLIENEWKPGIVITTELPPEVYMRRLAAARSGVNSRKIYTGFMNSHEQRAANEALGWLEESGCFILPGGAPSVDQCRAAIRQAAYAGAAYAVVDSMSNLTVPGITDLYETTRLSMLMLKEVNMETGVPVFTTCQIGRSIKGRDTFRPQIHDAKGAGDVEQGAWVLGGLYYDHWYVSHGMKQSEPGVPSNMVIWETLKHNGMDTETNRVDMLLEAGVRLSDWVDTR